VDKVFIWVCHSCPWFLVELKVSGGKNLIPLDSRDVIIGLVLLKNIVGQWLNNDQILKLK